LLEVGHHPYGHLVVGTEQGRKAVPRGQQCLRRYPASLGGEIALAGPHALRIDAVAAQFAPEALQSRDVVGSRRWAADDRDFTMLVLEERLGRDDAALHVVSRETLVADALEDPIEHDDVGLLAPECNDVLLEQVVAQHDQSVAVAVDQKLRTLDGLAPFIG